MATFEINGLNGSFDGSTWRIEDPELKIILEGMADLYRPDGYIPDRTTDVVRFVMDQLGGRLIEADPVVEAEDVPGRVYQKLKGAQI